MSKAGRLNLIHHTAVWIREPDVEPCLRFYRDGLGLELLADLEVAEDFENIFHAPYRRLRSLQLGDPRHLDSGVYELIVFSEPSGAEPEPSAAVLEPGPPRLLLISLYTDLDEVLPRLAGLGFGETREMIVNIPDAGACRVVSLRDPVGVLVELADHRIADAVLS